jgi:dihydrofolate reductase
MSTGPTYRGALPALHLIAACTRVGRVIGDGLKLPWHYPEDFRFFKNTTRGHAVIMGRKSWDSLEKRPLPARPNLVVTRQAGIELAGALVFPDLDSAIAASFKLGEPPPFIIGGAQIYAQSLPRVTRMYITEIQAEYPGDTVFPPFPVDEWRVVSRRYSADGALEFLIYDRIS